MRNKRSFLDHQEGVTVAFLDFVEALGRPLLESEARAFRFLLIEWEALSIKAALKRIPQAKLAYYTELMGRLREAISPDPINQLRLKREKPPAVAEMNSGNYSLKTPLFKGVSIRRMNAAEATERVSQLAKLAGHVAAISRELALVRNRDRPEAARIGKLSRRIGQLSDAFAERCTAAPAIPAERSLDEIMEEMKTLNTLMAEPVKS